jgi:poly[(R)-3-hydroxyalkanoate] polymerase subunit PhaE
VGHDPWPEWQAAAASDVARFTRAAEHFAAAVRAHFSGADHPSAAAAEERTRNFSEALRDLFADFPLRFAPDLGARDLGAGIGSQAAQRGTWDAPALGATREHQLRWQRMSEALASIDDAQRRLQRLWSDALRDAAAAFTAHLVQPPLDMSVESVRKLYDDWIDCAEDAYGRIAHSEPFCSALADLMNAGSRWRREAQTSMEYFARLLDLPTRTEINSLMQRLKAVENRLRDSPNSAAAKAAAAAARKVAAAAGRKAAAAGHKPAAAGARKAAAKPAAANPRARRRAKRERR